MNDPAAPAPARSGAWAELRLAVLEPHERAPGLPDETARTPLTARIKGFLEADARPGEPVAVHTLAGRRVEGVLLRVSPASGHSFGEPQPELLGIGPELRARLAGRERAGG